jgi:hypothetical protein
MQAARPGDRKVDLAIEFRRFAAQHLFNVRPQRVVAVAPIASTMVLPMICSRGTPTSCA